MELPLRLVFSSALVICAQDSRRSRPAANTPECIGRACGFFARPRNPAETGAVCRQEGGALQGEFGGDRAFSLPQALRCAAVGCLGAHTVFVLSGTMLVCLIEFVAGWKPALPGRGDWSGSNSGLTKRVEPGSHSAMTEIRTMLQNMVQESKKQEQSASIFFRRLSVLFYGKDV